MTIVRCQRGHYYDDVKFNACPHCNAPQHGAPPTSTLPAFSDMEKTVAKRRSPEDDEATQSFLDAQDSEKTIGIFASQVQASPVVGWLVAMDGPERGRDYRLHAGRNFIGRNWKNDVCIVDDKKISREGNASIVYDPKTNSFSIVPGTNGAMTYHDNSIMEPVQIQDRDIFEIGETRLMFIAFCKEELRW